jgi:predicted nucleic acid-binding protein
VYLLDTNIISETRRHYRANSNVTAWLAATDSNSLYTSVVVMMELERGILGMERKDPQQGAILREWLNAVIKPAFAGRVLPIDERTTAICAALHIPSQAPANDAWIAATALQHGYTLITRNTADFERTGAKLLNPFAGVV